MAMSGVLCRDFAASAIGRVYAGILVWRRGALNQQTALEDRELHRRLDGYADDARQVRYWLVSWV